MRWFVCTPLALLLPLFVSAGSDQVAWPENYISTYVRYHSVDKPKEKSPARVRFFYVNPEALAAARPAAPLPSPTVLIMEDHLAVLGADGEPLRDAAGRFIPAPEVTNVFVQEKRTGWGTEYPEAIRNGEWEYARFNADGSRTEGAKFDGCFTCHKAQAASDFNFTFTPFVERMKR